MIKFLYESVGKLKNKNSSLWSIMFKIYKLILNIVYPMISFFKKKSGVDANSTVIASLTTFPARINTVWITISSILNQTVKPKRVILWLAEEQFPDRKIPYSLKRLCKRGLEIKYCEDIKPHKKYFYTMKENPDDTIITFDDDILYPENTIELLCEGAEKFPDTVICMWSHRISYDENLCFLPYNEWKNCDDSKPSLQIIPIGCGSVLYPPKCMHKELYNLEELKNTALYTDDLWLKCMEVKNNYKAVNYNKFSLIFFNLIYTQNNGLWKKNTMNENRNDIVWKKLSDNYPEMVNTLLNDYKRGE